MKVAMGPRNSEAMNHRNPLRSLPCAIPALISATVPQPTAYVWASGIDPTVVSPAMQIRDEQGCARELPRGWVAAPVQDGEVAVLHLI